MKRYWATHPMKPDHYGGARGRKLHYKKDKKYTLCGMLLDGEFGRYLGERDTCKNCKSLLKITNN